MTARERYLATFSFQPVDRPFVGAVGGWSETGERWKREGWDGSSLTDLFHTDTLLTTGVYYGPIPHFEYKVLEENERTRLYVNHEGIVMREFLDYNGNSSMPHFVKFPVESEADFEAFCAERLQPDFEPRAPANWADLVQAFRTRTDPLLDFANRWGGFFGSLRNLLGVQNLCLAFYDNPRLVERMMDQRVEVVLAVTERVLAEVEIDTFGFWEDMGFKTASLLGPEHFRRFMLPRYVKVTQWLRSKGVKHVGVDSDGQVGELIPLWLEAGLDMVWPMEVAAGMDVVALRRQYGQSLNMLGGIDKRAVAVGGQAMRDEVDRVMPAVEAGGYSPQLDHSAPPDISWRNMCEYMEYLVGRLERG